MFGYGRCPDSFVLGDLTHDYSLVVDIEASADMGKTATMVAIVLDLMTMGYKYSEIHSNIPLLGMLGYHYHSSDNMRLFLRKVLAEDIRHTIMLFDEWDSIFPSRGFGDKLQTQDLLKLNQMTKTENWVIGTRHLGSSIDKLIRDCTNIWMNPRYIPSADLIVVEMINAVDCLDEIVKREVYPVSEIFPHYLRWKPTK